MLRAVQQNDDRDPLLAPRHDETTGQHSTVTGECCLPHPELNSLTRNAIEIDPPDVASRKRYNFPVATIGPAVGTVPDSIGTLVQSAGSAIELAPAQRIAFRRGNINQPSVSEPIAA